MAFVWRLVKARFAREPFSGEGGRLFGGRWNNVGVPAIYTSEHRSLAALEVLVHLNGIIPTELYRMISYEIDEAWTQALPAGELPPDWRQEPPSPSTMDWGSQWARDKRSVALAVPSAVIPEEKNIILNPDHPDVGKVKAGPATDFAFDPRLFA
ncbi:MAG: RES family NAD+ phosphorylase [Verrucomicrobiota bacterium]